MPVLTIVLDGDGAWPDLAEKLRSGTATWLANDGRLSVAGLTAGMTSGKPSVAIRIDLPDGRVVVAETSLVLFEAAARALRARHGIAQPPGAA